MTRPRVVIPAERMFAFPVSAKVQSGRPAEGAAAGNKALAVALAIGIVHAGHALAWGDEGHRIVAEIAEQYLEPEAVRQLLALENATTLAEVSTWADEIRGQRRETARWHYVNIPINPPTGGNNADRDCPRG